MVRDISERKHAQQQLRRSEAFHRIAIEAGRIGSWDLDLSTHISTASARMIAMLGLPAGRQEFLVQDWQEVVVPEDHAALLRTLDVCINWDDAFNIKYRVAQQDGELRCLYSRGALYEESGGRTRLHGATIDITKEKSTEEALRVSNDRLHLAIEGASDGVWDWDLKRNIPHYSALAKKIIGYAANELADRDVEWSSRVHPDDSAIAWTGRYLRISANTGCAARTAAGSGC